MRDYSKDRSSAPTVGASFEIYSIFEYNETNGISGYQQGADAIVTKRSMSSLDFNPIKCDVQNTGYKCEVVSTTGILSVTAIITRNTTNINGTVQSPSFVKFSIEITYPNRRPGTYVALEARLRVQSSYGREERGEQGTDKIARFGPNTLTWIQTVEVGERTAAVVASNSADVSSDDTKESDDSNESTDCKSIFFSFIDTGSEPIFWDPQLGYDNAVLSSAFAFVPSVLLVLVLALLV